MQLVHVSEVVTIILVVHRVVQGVIPSPHDRGNPAVIHMQADSAPKQALGNAYDATVRGNAERRSARQTASPGTVFGSKQ